MFEGGGLKPNTLQKSLQISHDFGAIMQLCQYAKYQCNYASINYGTMLEDILEPENVEELQKCLIDYFERFRVGKKGQQVWSSFYQIAKRGCQKSKDSKRFTKNK